MGRELRTFISALPQSLEPIFPTRAHKKLLRDIRNSPSIKTATPRLSWLSQRTSLFGLGKFGVYTRCMGLRLSTELARLTYSHYFLISSAIKYEVEKEHLAKGSHNTIWFRTEAVQCKLLAAVCTSGTTITSDHPQTP